VTTKGTSESEPRGRGAANERERMLTSDQQPVDGSTLPGSRSLQRFFGRPTGKNCER